METRHPTKILKWQEVQPTFQYYMNVWSNHIPLNLASTAWFSLNSLKLYHNETEKRKACSYALVVALIYYEYCHRTTWADFDFINFTAWNEQIHRNFVSDFIPEEFETEGFLRALSNRMTDDGLLMFNRLYFFDGDKKKTKKYFDTIFKLVFPKGRYLEVYGNWILLNK